jgi:hypothetical protein
LKEVLLILALILAAAWLVVKNRRSKAEMKEAASAKSLHSTSAFHAVSLKYSSRSCDAAKAMTGHRYLATAAPKLPLPECDASDCHCGFIHHADRRSGEDRRSPFDSGIYAGATGTFRAERRGRKDRRQPADLVSV